MEKRLNLLCQAGIIDQDICDGMLNVVTELESVWEIPMCNEQGEMAITHMANALMRSRRGEEIGPLDDELLTEIREADVYPQLQQVHQSLMAPFAVTLHPNEEGYLLANLYSLWMVHKS